MSSTNIRTTEKALGETFEHYLKESGFESYNEPVSILTPNMRGMGTISNVYFLNNNTTWDKARNRVSSLTNQPNWYREGNTPTRETTGVAVGENKLDIVCQQLDIQEGLLSSVATIKIDGSITLQRHCIDHPEAYLASHKDIRALIDEVNALRENYMTLE